MSSGDFINFQDTFEQFLNFSKQVLKYNLSGELILLASGGSKTNAIQTQLKGYERVYLQTRDSKKHLDKFKEVFKKCKPKLLDNENLDDFMSWFQDTSFSIIPQEKSRNRIQLTAIFRNSVRIADHMNEEAEKHPDTAEQYYNDPASVYPEQFMLYLFRLFSCCCDEKEKELLFPLIQDLESRLNLEQDEIPDSGDGFSDLVSAASSVAKDVGINLPKGAGNGLNSNQFKEALNMFTKDEGAKNTMKEMFNDLDLENPESMTDVLSKLMGKMGENARNVPEPVARSLKAESEPAALTQSDNDQ